MEAGVRRVGSSTVLGRPYLQHAALTRRQFVPCNTFVTSGAILQRASVVLRQRAVPCVARAVAVRTPSRPSVAEERLPLPPTTADGYIPAVADAEDLLREHGACGVGLVASVHNERSREIVEKAIMALGCMEHRGGCAADDVSGDGAGVMTEIPWDLLRMDFPALREGSCGVGQVFFPDHDGAEAACRALFAEEAKKAGFDLLGWRCVPVDVAAIGPAARRTLPRIRQVALRWTGEDAAPEVLERELYVLRRVVESRVPGALDAMLAAEAVPAGASHPAALRARSAALAEQVYVCSLSGRSVVYKGMLASSALSRAFGDLQSPSFRSAWALYHRRFSTNTTPAWRLAQPMRVLGHNGEINTLQGNLNWVAAGEREMVASCASWAGDAGRLRAMLPLASPLASDSANLDRLAELMLRSGVEAPQALAALVPEAYRHNPALRELGPQAADFYSYYEGLQEGWDGPALLVFCDGRRLGARLDRNGLRPARYWRTARGLVHVASEVGVLGDVLDAAPDVLEKGRLGPGEMLAVDLEERRFWPARELVVDVAARQPYADWLRRCARPLLAARREAEERGAVDGVSEEAAPGSSGSSLLEGAAPASEGLARASTGAPILEAPVLSAAALWRAQTGAGYGLEDTSLVLESMATSGAEPIFCMGDDTPPAVLSGAAHVLSDYFKQRFAQVTNPPIDPLREGLVMSLEMRVGGRGNVLAPGPRAYRQVVLPSPVLFEGDVEVLARDEQLGTCTLDTRYRAEDPDSLRRAVLALCDAACDAVRSRGAACLLLRDRGDERSLGAEPWAERPAIPAALATGAVHHALIREGLRSRTSVVVDTAQCASTHQLAVLVGYGAHAVCPWLALESVRAWRAAPRTRSLIKAGKLPEVSARGAQRNLAHALEKGLLKIMSKMGISLLSCYHGAQVFEALGLGPDVVDLAFRGTPSRLGGLSMRELARESESFWFAARTGGSDGAAPAKLADFGFVQHRPRGEHHGNNQAMAKLLHKALGLGSRGADGTGGAHGGDADAFAAYRAHVDASPPVALRDLLEVRTRLAPLPLDRVEPVESIVRRFCTGGMSLGAISRETHETIALAMNRLGGKSNSGEGGEDPVRWEELADVGPDGRSARLPHLRGLRRGDTANSRIKQVASGRFGVTPHFLVNAEQLEIKIAQGAKPGEGGQLPGKKVSPYIAALRRSKPGVPLISPPPHHDIYSIEDLAQLVHDLHAVSPAALVSVKLVAQAGIGTVACGVAKAGADVIQVSGADGGTGASPVSSIKHAGGPVEMGLAETHAALVAAGLRDRVVLRADGGMRRGRDVIVAAALGADEVGFGTAAMLATGCIMARVCHTNNCPVGVASQREDLRARFPGVAADLVDFMLLVASEVRAELASLGLASLDELVGRPGALGLREGARASKTAHLDLSLLCSRGGPAGGSPDACTAAGSSSSQRIAAPARPLPRLLDDDVLDRDDVRAAIAGGAETLDLALDVRNTDRAAFARVGGAVARRWGDAGFEGRLRFDVRGAAGQSFAAFLVRGMEVRLVGEANDYVCKGMAGGLVTLNPPENAGFDPGQASIAGNTCLYGATGGSLFVHGRVGERFAVRNSAARAVVEGAGDHCCEYMTGGVVVCLGAAGRNAAAGMTGGVAYFYDPLARFGERVNGEIVAVQRVGTRAGEAQLKGLLEEHVGHTGSRAARAVLDDWEAQLPHFWQLVPPSEANTPECSRLAEEAQEEEARELERAAA